MKEYFLLIPDGKSKFKCDIIEWDGTGELLDFMYQAIGCSSVETIRLPLERLKTQLLFIVDEEGLFRDNKLNWILSPLYGGRIMGKALCGTQGIRDGEPDIVGFPDKDTAYNAARDIFREYMRK